jgi:hypothetical protein
MDYFQTQADRERCASYRERTDKNIRMEKTGEKAMMNKGATFSPCRKYRYTLTRSWNQKQFCLFVCLNPSTADEHIDDPTVRRCIRFAESWGYGGMVMCNLIPFRSTDPKKIYDQDNRPMWSLLENERYIKKLTVIAGMTIAAWGAHGAIQDMGQYYIKNILHNPHYLSLTKDGHPGHPLYLKKTLQPKPFSEAT